MEGEIKAVPAPMIEVTEKIGECCMAPENGCHTHLRKIAKIRRPIVWHCQKRSDPSLSNHPLAALPGRARCRSSGRGIAQPPFPLSGHPQNTQTTRENSGAIPSHIRKPPETDRPYGTVFPVPYANTKQNQPHKGQVLALLLSCPHKTTPQCAPGMRLGCVEKALLGGNRKFDFLPIPSHLR